MKNDLTNVINEHHGKFDNAYGRLLTFRKTIAVEEKISKIVWTCPR